jgi:L-aminopeptidase/D-esterase-like protein
MGNTVIGVVATNAKLEVAQLGSLASAGHDGLARVIRPAHTLYDGDTLFALATDQVEANPLLLADLAAEAVSLAILNGVRAAEPAGGLPSARTCAL